MRRQALWGLLVVAAALPAVGCSEDQPINQVGVNVVEKSLFDGSWYMSRTVISTDYESSSFGTFTGDSAYDYATGGFSVPRIRWVIDQSFLYAYRDVPLIQGANADQDNPDFRGQPVAAFKITSHFDIRRAYDPTTGQEQNVIVENSSDGRWYDRRYMRVDWTQNHVVSYQYLGSEIYELLGFWHRESAPLWVGPGSDFPASWLPSFDFMSCANPTDGAQGCRRQDRDFAGDYPVGQLYHMSFVTQEIHSPGMVPDPYTGANVPFCMSPYSDAPSCNPATVMVRTSFLRVSGHDFEPVNWSDSRFDRFGYFRNEMPTFDRSVGTPDDYELGRTDYMNYTASRQNIWRRVWQRGPNGEIARDENGQPLQLPYTDPARQVRQIVWHTTPDAPAHLIRPVMKLTSDWNVIYMQAVRRLRGQDVPEYEPASCQTDDPSGHCYCVTTPDGTVVNPTCPGVYDPFETPDEQAARITNGAAPYDCHIHVPEGAEPSPDADWTAITDSSFDGWFNSEYQGGECVTITRVNSCNRAAMRAWEALGSDPATRPICQERGDLRYKFLAYIDEPGTPFLGVATLRADPVTGETITGDANIGGPALDSSRTRYMYFYDLLQGNISEQEFIYGEDIRSYFESLNHVEQPAVPNIDFLTALDPTSRIGGEARERLGERFGEVLARTAPLRQPDGAAQTYTSLIENLRGTDIERRLTDNPETMALAGIQQMPDNAHVTEEILDRASPLRVNVRDRLANHRAVLERANFYGIEFQIDEYSDESVLRFIEQRATWPRQRVMFEINRAVYEGTQLHEMGHCLGLRHDFGGTADTEHYLDGYYQLNDILPFPRVDAFDTDGTPGLSATEQVAYEDAYQSTVQQRARSNIYRFMNSSIMDYTADFAQRTGEVLGLYDTAAVTFGYSDLVEVSHNTDGRPRREITPINTPRVWWKWYQGGDACRSDSDCPYSAGGSRSGELAASQQVTQRCGPNELSPDGAGICSNFDDDMWAPLGSDPDSSTAEWQPVKYRFCTDDQVGRIGWCHRFDNGDSYREIVRYAREQYDRYYIFGAFRRYRASFDYQTYFASVFRQYDILESLFNSMFWEYVSGDRAVEARSGNYGFADHYAATVDAMNFFVRVLAQPSVGTYGYDPGWRRYERISSYETGGDFYLGLGQAKYDYTIYQRGLTGINRLERIGILYDRIFALQLLAQRGGGAYRRDLPFLVNYYDLFPLEMQQLFNGMIRDDPTNYSARLICGEGGAGRECPDARIVYMDIYRGDCRDPESPSCRPDPVTETYRRMPIVNSGVSILAQIYGAIFGLSSFPTYYDSTFQRQLFVCIEGQGNCNAPPEGAVENVDYARYRSNRFGKTYLAFNVQSSTSGASADSIGFQMVKEARDLSFIIQAIQYIDRGEPVPAGVQSEIDRIGYVVPTDDNERAQELQRLDGRLRDVESFFTQLLQLENQMGILDLFRF